MMALVNSRVVLRERPADKIIPGQTFHKESCPMPSSGDLKDGQIMVEVLLISLEPAMRGWLKGTLTEQRICFRLTPS